MTATVDAPKRTPTPVGSGRRAAVAGILAAFCALAAAELLAALFDALSPLVAVGGWVVDWSPPATKEWAIRSFGTNDKAVVLLCVTLVVVMFGSLAGRVAARRREGGYAVVGAVGLLGALAAVTRPNGAMTDAWAPLFGAIAGAIALAVLLRYAVPTPPLMPAQMVPEGERPAPTPARSPARPRRLGPTGDDRRRFLLAGAVAAVGAASAGGLAKLVRHRLAVADARNAVALPAPQVATPAAPAGADLGVAGISSFITPNDRFYRVDTALSVPQITPSSWRLRVRGMVDQPFTIDYPQLLARPMVERDLTLACVSNPVGGRYAGTARFLGTPLAPLLQEAGIRAGADQLVSRSVDGFTAGTPLSAVLDGRDALLVVGMNGEPLPVDHGFPARMVVPGLYGYVSATKWLVDLEVSTFAAFDAYWVERGWAQQAPVKVMARIDTPTKSSTKAGTVPVGGVAWAMHRGIATVEVRVDDGPWNEAELGAVPSDDTWRQWVWNWPATPGRHRLWARATTADGEVQTSKEADTVPDGATGWHHIDVTVS